MTKPIQNRVRITLRGVLFSKEIKEKSDKTLSEEIEMKLTNIKIIENSVEEKIKVCDTNMYVEPVRTLDDLLLWENLLQKRKTDYVIAEFETSYKSAEDVLTYGKFYSIFVKQKVDNEHTEA